MASEAFDFRKMLGPKLYPSPYNETYPARWDMSIHDDRNELRRWFDNYKADRTDVFAGDCEWLVIEEVRFTVGRKKRVRYVGEIGADHHDRRRKVTFDLSAPPPPTLMRAAKEKYVKPVKTVADDLMRVAEITRQLEAWRMIDMLRGWPEPPPPPRPNEYRRNGS